MTFWICFYLIAIVAVLGVYILPSWSCLICRSYLFFLWFVGSFRYMYGDDYGMYEVLYNDGTIENVLISAPVIEPTFYWMVEIYNQLGLNAQCMFLTYSTIVLIFIYFGLKYFFYDYKSRLLVLTFYGTATLTGGYMFSLNGMRQAAAIAIMFYAYKYVIICDFKRYTIFFLLAGLFHYSTFIFYPIYFLSRKKLSYLFSLVGVTVISLFTITGITQKLFFEAVKSFAAIYGKYEGQIDLLQVMTSSIPPSSLFALMIYLLIILGFRAYENNYDLTKKEIFLFNTTTIYIFLRMFFSFGIEGANVAAIIHRFEIYFLLCYISLFVFLINKVLEKRKYLQVLLSLMWVAIFSYVNLMAFIHNLDDPFKSVPPSVQSGHVEDNFNFELLNPYVW